ncbi:titin isoform X2 [Anthonomus grandis grandis]|uniref:titin isoform X2 n=1 Tax=Anthonomus grandis grandis TaxID=2921223 RepID=UPI0021654CC6|nr:titin isoform X2 [Anthonomus grandis grandis]
MKQNGGQQRPKINKKTAVKNNNSKKKRLPVKTAGVPLRANTKPVARKSSLKTIMKKKKEPPIKDTVAETIAFVIKGKLTPIKPSEPPKAQAKKVKDRNDVVEPKRPKKKRKKDIDLSINKIINKYAKKLNVKTQNKPQKTKLKKKKTEITDEPSIAPPIKIKEEKVENDFPIATVVKIEVESDKEPTTTVEAKEVKKEDQEEPNQSVKLLKKKSQPQIKKKHAQMDEKRRAKLIQFWNSPKRHREASLNAIAKVHCLYENESKASFDKMAENANAIIKFEPGNNINQLKTQPVVDTDSDEVSLPPVKRSLREVPGLRGVGKHYDMYEYIDSDNSDIELYKIPQRPRKVVRVKKEVKETSEEEEDDEEEVPKKPAGRPKKDPVHQKKRKPKSEEIYMDLKDMVVKKRMASLNATAILAASYSSNNKKMKTNSKTSCSDDSSDTDSDSSAEQYFAAIDKVDLTKDGKPEEEDKKDIIEVHTSPNKKVSVFLNQDTDVTITGVYVNSTTRSTHHEGYCSIAGMQYRISATSHTQTAATTVSSETVIQSRSSSENPNSDAQSCSSKSYTPLDALSSMQPPPGPGIHSGGPQPGHPALNCQNGSQMASPTQLQHGPMSAFTSPHHPQQQHGAPLLRQQGSCQPVPGDSPLGLGSGYYQPAGPLISLSHGHPPPTSLPPSKSVPLSEASPTSIGSSVHQINVAQNPPAPSSNNGDSSDNEVIITSVTAATKDSPLSAGVGAHQPSYRYPAQYSQYHAYPCPPPPPQYHYQTPPPPTPPYAHHDMCYPPPAGYLRHAKYPPSPGGGYHRYGYYSGDIYGGPPPSSGGSSAQASQQVIVTAPSAVSANGSFSAGPNGVPPPAIMEPYPPPPPAPPTLVDTYPPTGHYYQSPYNLPPSCYSHSPTRSIPYMSAPYQHCPLNSCPKNGHTGPLTGDTTGKRSTGTSAGTPHSYSHLHSHHQHQQINKDAKPLPPVALALPLEPVTSTGPPSPARGSAGMPSGGGVPPPTPSPKREDRGAAYAVGEKRKARVGKANVRSTMLLMCNPVQEQQLVKREIESPLYKEQESEERKKYEVLTPPLIKPPDKPPEPLPKIPEACTTTTIDDLPDPPSQSPITTKNPLENVTIREEPSDTIEAASAIAQTEQVIVEEENPAPPPPLPPCVATVAENVKVKNMKRKQSQCKEDAPPPPPKKSKKMSSYKDFIRKHTKGCFKISNNKKKLVSNNGTNKQKNAQQTNNRRMKQQKVGKKQKQKMSSSKILDSLISKNNIDKVIDEVVNKGTKVVSNTVKKTNSKMNNRRKSLGSRRGSRSVGSGEEKLEVTVKGKGSGAVVPKWSNGWMWEGEPYEGKVFINSDETTLIRKCYPSMRHKEGDLIRPGDCVLLKAGPRRNDLPYVAKIAVLWESPEDGEMMMSLLWYYRPEHTEQGRALTDRPDEVFASRHKDSNSVACIDDKCYVLTFNEYCRYKKNLKRLEEGMDERPKYVPLPDPYPRMRRQPPSGGPPVSPDMIFFCRKVYDFRQKRIVKNPT